MVCGLTCRWRIRRSVKKGSRSPAKVVDDFIARLCARPAPTRVGGVREFDIDARSVPAHQCFNRQPVAQVVQPRTVPESAKMGAYADRTGQPHEYLADRVLIEAKSRLRYQERFGLWMRVYAVANTGVAKKCLPRRLMHRHQALLSTFGLTNCEHPFTQVDVASVECQHFAEPHTCDRQQPQQRLISPRPQSRWGTHASGGPEKPLDLIVMI